MSNEEQHEHTRKTRNRKSRTKPRPWTSLLHKSSHLLSTLNRHRELRSPESAPTNIRLQNKEPGVPVADNSCTRGVAIQTSSHQAGEMDTLQNESDQFIASNVQRADGFAGDNGQETDMGSHVAFENEDMDVEVLPQDAFMGASCAQRMVPDLNDGANPESEDHHNQPADAVGDEDGLRIVDADDTVHPDPADHRNPSTDAFSDQDALRTREADRSAEGLLIDGGESLMTVELIATTAQERKDLRKRLRRQMLLKSNRRTFLAALTMYGKTRFTILQYEFLCFIVGVVNADGPHLFSLPGATTVRLSIWPFFTDNLFVKSTVLHLPLSKRFETPTVTMNNSHEDEVQPTHTASTIPTVVVLPSEWARYDVGTLPIYSNLYEEANEGELRELTIEDSAVLQYPEAHASHCQVLWVKTDLLEKPVSTGDVIAFQCVEEPTVHNRSVTADGWEYYSGYGLYDVLEGDCCTFSGVVCLSWSAGGLPREVGTDYGHWMSRHADELSVSERNVVQYLSAHVRGHVRLSRSGGSQYTSSSSISPGDICTVLKPQSNLSPVPGICVVVNHFWRSEVEQKADSVLWFRDSCSSPYIISSLNCVPVMVKQHIPISFAPWTSSARKESRFGTLQNGERYVVYRMLLYCDDFNPRSLLFPRGSVGGCYMLPLGLSLQRRRSHSSVRPISLTPPGVSTNHVLDAIIEDIIQGTTVGFAGVDATGRNVRIFLDVVGYVADYPASSGVLDVMSHASNAPCTHCSFRRRRVSRGSDFGYTTETNSTHPSFTRGMNRTAALRSNGLSANDARWLGMKTGDEGWMMEAARCPLVKLSSMMKDVRDRIPLTSNGCKVVGGSFDAYRNNAIAPDHLLTGLASHLLSAMFEQLKDPLEGERLDLAICTALKGIGCESQSSLYNSESGNVYSMSMSTVYCVITVTPYVLRSLLLNDKYPTFKLLQQLSELIAKTFSWPAISTDGVDAVSYVHGSGRTSYYADLRSRAAAYLKDVTKFCTDYPALKRFVDLPNLHRLLELYAHTVPSFGHANFVAELVLEGAHQPLKAVLARNTNANSHIPSFYQVLGRDWFTRIADTWALLENANYRERKDVMRSLRILFFGFETTKLNCTDDVEDEALISEMDSLVLGVLQNQVGDRLLQWYGTNVSSWDSACEWVGNGISNQCGNSDDLREPFCDRAVQMIEEIIARDEAEFGQLHLFGKALFKRKHGVRRAAYAQHCLTTGDVVEAFRDENEMQQVLIEPQTDGTGVSEAFVIRVLVGWEGSDLWALVTELKEIGDDMHRAVSVSVDDCKLLLMSSPVRKVHPIHACHADQGCTIHVDRKHVKHGLSVENMGAYFLIRRKNGYPPRQA